jgi:hypothetical protein
METEIKFYASPDGIPFDNDGRSWVAMKKDGKFTLIHKDGVEEHLPNLFLKNKEIEYPPHWPNAFKYRWEPLSKLPAPSGYVYVGKGGENELALGRYFGNNPKDLYSYYGEFKKNWSGIDQNQQYYVTQNVWNETFKGYLDTLNEKENMNKIKTKFKKELWALVKVEAKLRGRLANFSDFKEDDCILYDNENGFWADRNSATPDYEEIAQIEFLSFLYNLPEKELKFEKLPWPVTICGEVIKIGCKETNLEDISNIIEWLDDDEALDFEEYSIWPMKKKIHITNESSETIAKIDYKVWEEFVSFFKKAAKN